jgi:hypothetical protein
MKISNKVCRTCRLTCNEVDITPIAAVCCFPWCNQAEQNIWLQFLHPRRTHKLNSEPQLPQLPIPATSHVSFCLFHLQNFTETERKRHRERCFPNCVIKVLLQIQHRDREAAVWQKALRFISVGRLSVLHSSFHSFGGC